MNRARIILAEDDPELRHALALALREEGYSVSEAASGEEALSILSQRTVDLVVTDMNMDGVPGAVVGAMARTAGVDTPILVITGDQDSGIRASVERLEHSDLLLKPFSIDELVRRVRTLLAHRAA
jgi:DNA-binding response OmpR family regulator